MASTEAGKWLEEALMNLRGKSSKSGIELDVDVIKRLVSYCEHAQPQDAKEFITNIIGTESSQDIVTEYLDRQLSRRNLNLSMLHKEDLQAYMKPPAEDIFSVSINKKATKGNEKANTRKQQESKVSVNPEGNEGAKGKVQLSRKKKGTKVITLEEAAKGSVVFNQGKPCDCQARRHKLVANCLCCGKIICEQTGEGPCSFCGVLVLREGSNYADLDNITIPISDNEAAAAAFKNRLVEYDRNAAERTVVIDDQSDYYEFEGNAWISEEEKKLLRQKQEEIEEEEKARRSKLVVTFDLLGRKVVMTEEEAAETDTQGSILRTPLSSVNESSSRIIANPSIREQPVFVKTAPSKNTRASVHNNKKSKFKTGICLEKTGRVQHDDPLVEALTFISRKSTADDLESSDYSWKEPTAQRMSHTLEDKLTGCSING